MNTQSGNAHLHNMWGEIALITAVTINSFGVVLMLYSAAGISAISSVPYAFSLVLPRLTLGTWTYIFQGVLILTLMIMRKKFVPQYLCSFIVGFVFGKMLDIHEMWIGALPTALPWRTLYFVISYILICIGIALSNRCGLPIIPTDLFPRELSEIISAKYSKVKISFDVICLATTAAMTGFILGHIYGLGIGTVLNHYKGIMAGIGTVLAAFTMGKGIAIVGNAMDKHIAIAPYITNHIRRHGSHNAQYAGR